MRLEKLLQLILGFVSLLLGHIILNNTHFFVAVLVNQSDRRYNTHQLVAEAYSLVLKNNMAISKLG